MNTEHIVEGYYGIFNPPLSILEPVTGGTIYYVTNEYRNILIVIPMIPNFFVDIVKIMKRIPARDIILIAPDIGPRFISDYIESWYFITRKCGKSCRIFSRYMPEEKNTLSQEFIYDIKRNLNEAFSFIVARTAEDTTTIQINLSTYMVDTRSPGACDVLLSSCTGRKLLLCEMNEDKASALKDELDLYDEIHMPFIEGTYPTMTYQQLMLKYPSMIQKIRVNHFSSRDELQAALSRGVKVGRLVSL